MKKILFLLVACILSVASGMAQDADMMAKAQARFKNMKTLTAPVTQTRHNAALTDDVVSKGTFYFKKPSNACMTFNGGKDMLLISGDTFTMVKDGKPSTFKGKGNAQMDALKSLLKNFSAGQESEQSIEDFADVDMDQKGDIVTLNIVPRIEDAKAKKRMMFKSFVVVMDTKAGELKSIRLNEKGSNYTLYEFGKFTVDAPIADSVFNVK